MAPRPRSAVHRLTPVKRGCIGELRAAAYGSVPGAGLRTGELLRTSLGLRPTPHAPAVPLIHPDELFVLAAMAAARRGTPTC